MTVASSAESEAVVSVRGLTKVYRIAQGLFGSAAALRAVDGVEFSIPRGKTLAVVGESGCGKSTLARMVSLIERPTSGSMTLAGQDMDRASATEIKSFRRHVQVIFQDPYSSLNPRHRVGTILEEPLVINTPLKATERSDQARAMMARVGLRPEHYRRFPHMFSGGQRQRIAIARALMLRPDLVVADEPVSALDLSIQAQVLNLLMDLQQEFGLAYLFISHGLAVVRHMADEVMVMYLGRVVEIGPKAEIFTNPRHPYTRALQASAVSADRRHVERVPMMGEPPSPLDPPSGCAFRTRCPHASDRCAAERPELRMVGGQRVACHYAETI
ncbi:MAG TPA: dipeptide ABC transporter ATP-binding protein [Magnetospirillaceae bacterium]|jgi:dipeptide transport system ATP-binding protein